MVKEGICVFSGYEVPKGSGLIKVMNDTRSFLFLKKKTRSLGERKINPRVVKWTTASRVFHKKGTKKTEKKAEKTKIVKEIRGFPFIPSSVVRTAQEKAKDSEKVEKKTEDFKKHEKVTKFSAKKQGSSKSSFFNRRAGKS